MYVSTSLSCAKDTDKFSVVNSNVELKYPVVLATAPEMNIMIYSTLRATGQNYWLLSPRIFVDAGPVGCKVMTSGYISGDPIQRSFGVRPVVSLAPSNDQISGTGAYDNPYIIVE